MTHAIHARRIFLAAALLALPGGSALAERADRDKPVNLEADRVTVDDVNKVQIFEGRVTLTQGTLIIRGDKLVVTQDLAGFQSGVASGNPARFRVKREGRDDFIEGEGERIEHDAKTETTKFFNRAYVKSGQDEVRGQYIVYDGLAENYVVTSGPGGTVKPGAENRVRAVIQPKNKDGAQASPATGAPVRLQIAPNIANPRQE
jgi:lipopolysaccharide export system protein LptA